MTMITVEMTAAELSALSLSLTNMPEENPPRSGLVWIAPDSIGGRQIDSPAGPKVRYERPQLSEEGVYQVQSFDCWDGYDPTYIDAIIWTSFTSGATLTALAIGDGNFEVTYFLEHRGTLPYSESDYLRRMLEVSIAKLSVSRKSEMPEETEIMFFGDPDGWKNSFTPRELTLMGE